MTSPHYCYNECMGTRKEKLYFDVRVQRVKTHVNAFQYFKHYSQEEVLQIQSSCDYHLKLFYDSEKGNNKNEHL